MLISGLTNNYFGMSEVIGLGFSVSSFFGYAGATDSTAMTT